MKDATFAIVSIAWLATFAAVSVLAPGWWKLLALALLLAGGPSYERKSSG